MARQTDSQRSWSDVIRFVWWAVVGFAVWLAMAARWSKPEIAAGIAAGIIVAIAAALRPARLVNWRVRPVWLRDVIRLPVQIVHDLGLLTVALFRPRHQLGVFRALPFDVGDDGPEDAGRRALIALAGSIGPNTFIVGYDIERSLVLVHQLIENEQVLPIKNGRYPAQ